MAASKDEIRRTIRALKRGLDNRQRQNAEADVLFRLMQCDEITQSHNLLLYYSLPDELPTLSIIKSLLPGRHIFLPRVNGDNLEIVEFTGHNLATGAFGIKEPTGEAVDIKSIDTVIVPGMAFDRKGKRLGRGKGYYDRLLRNTRCWKAGIAFNCQIIEEVPHENHDITMDIIITEKETIRPEKG